MSQEQVGWSFAASCAGKEPFESAAKAHEVSRRRKRVIGVYGSGPRDATGTGASKSRRTRTIGVYDSRRKFDKGVPDFTIDQGREAMGCDWMTVAELSQAIPPAYTRWIGERLMQHLAQPLRAAA